ncbi:MAG: M56 family metallopeptidase [Oscillospiraceae bacterium]|jgi:beta-lactamase regulating signal transducer with metallopeptidase domain|nr:M56 family metallopeptidase [Oscillospiraceae bacterium]
MTSIWSFFAQTLEVSLLAAMLLLLKHVLRDKLSPRWQYGIWNVLALRALLPAGLFGRFLLPQVSVLLETAKSAAENLLFSNYTNPYAPLHTAAPLPWVNGTPKSVTDWLFLVYIAGVLACLLRYALGYIRLRRILRRGTPATAGQQAVITQVCERYSLKNCRVVAIGGLPSAFVCGILRPVLALPLETLPDEKVILHELLHYRNKDALQSVLWSLLRALHWCNPFLRFVFNQIGNDMESLCDQRVLERLQGEERREYGGILLAMTNERYPRAPGTTSLSNGGKYISQRILAIARFKKYPRGMALVSVCIGVVLLLPALFGASAVTLPETSFASEDSFAFSYGMAGARLRRCTTLAGALDTYAKGLLYANPAYLAAASPLSEQAKLVSDYKSIISLSEQLGVTPFESEYYILNLARQPGGSFTAHLVFFCSDADSSEYNQGFLYYILPITASRDRGWRVTPNGDFEIIKGPERTSFFDPSTLPSEMSVSQQCKTGLLNVSYQSCYSVNNREQTQSEIPILDMGYNISRTAKPDAKFDSADCVYYVTFLPMGSDEELAKIDMVSLIACPLKGADEIPHFSYDESDLRVNSRGMNGSDGSSFQSRRLSFDRWKGNIIELEGSYDYRQNTAIKTPEIPPEAYAVRIYFDKVLQEEVIVRRNAE